nr:interferon-induced protein 44-like isoform X4 [Pongo pygmaeus]
MEVTTRLTWNDENHLRKLLGNVSLSLLYKSSVHGGSIENMVERCSHQGCTITMTYIDDNMIVAFMLGNYINLHESSTEPNDSLWFSLQKKNDTTEIETLLLNTAPKIIDEQLVCRLSKKDIFILCRDNKIYLDKMITRNLKLRFYGYHQYLEREVFRVEGIKDNLDDTKRIMKAREHRNRLLADIRAYKPYADLVSEIRILLVGPIGSGKSSFFNSVKSIFHGHVTGQAIVGSDITSITERDRIHCVAYVLDINSIDNLSSKMLAKFKQVHKEVLNCGIAHVALLTKVDDCSEVLQDNFLNMSRSMTSQSQVMNVHKMLGIPISNILMVGNYASDLELDPIKDILILSALRQMLRAADDFLEDLPLEETGAIKRVLQPCI